MEMQHDVRYQQRLLSAKPGLLQRYVQYQARRDVRLVSMSHPAPAGRLVHRATLLGLDPDAVCPEKPRYPKFGVGVVASQEGDGDFAKLEVRFTDRVRKLQAKFVKPIE